MYFRYHEQLRPFDVWQFTVDIFSRCVQGHAMAVHELHMSFQSSKARPGSLLPFSSVKAHNNETVAVNKRINAALVKTIHRHNQSSSSVSTQAMGWTIILHPLLEPHEFEKTLERSLQTAFFFPMFPVFKDWPSCKKHLQFGILILLAGIIGQFQWLDHLASVHGLIMGHLRNSEQTNVNLNFNWRALACHNWLQLSTCGFVTPASWGCEDTNESTSPCPNWYILHPVAWQWHFFH